MAKKAKKMKKAAKPAKARRAARKARPSPATRRAPKLVEVRPGESALPNAVPPPSFDDEVSYERAREKELEEAENALAEEPQEEEKDRRDEEEEPS